MKGCDVSKFRVEYDEAGAYIFIRKGEAGLWGVSVKGVHPTGRREKAQALATILQAEFIVTNPLRKEDNAKD